MKSPCILVIALAAVLTGCSATSSMDGSRKKASKIEKRAAQYEQTTGLIDGGNFEFTAQSANPTGGKTVQFTSSYTLEAKEGIYQAYLPYFGRAYHASYGGDGGIEFEGAPEELSIQKDENKQNLTLSFNIHNNDEKYECTLVVGYGGNGSLTIISSKRQTISYYGSVAALSEKE